MGLRPLACWDCGFESRRQHGCLSVVRVMCCQEISLQCADRSSRGVLPIVVCLSMIAEPQRWEGAGPVRLSNCGGIEISRWLLHLPLSNMSEWRADAVFTVEQGEAAFFTAWCHIDPEDLACSLYDSFTLFFAVYSMFKITTKKFQQACFAQNTIWNCS